LIRIRICIKVKIQELKRLKWSLGGPWTHTIEMWRLKMEPRRFCRPVVADSHYFDAGRIRNRSKVKIWIRIRIKVMRIRNSALGNDPDSVALRTWSGATQVLSATSDVTLIYSGKFGGNEVLAFTCIVSYFPPASIQNSAGVMVWDGH
jgi:hypothetical protein